MNRKEADKIQPGALVRYSFSNSPNTQKAIVVAKEYQAGQSMEKVLCQKKEHRYLLTVSWLPGDPNRWCQNPGTIEKISHWDLMVVSHAV